MTRRIPVVATLVVAAAVATMIALGVWQLHRLAWKEALIARYARAETISSAIPWPRDPAAAEAALFRHAQIRCDRVLAQDATAGRNLAGVTGWAQTARCALDGGGEASVALGWTQSPAIRPWPGGEIEGVVAPGEGGSVRLIAGKPPAGLQPLVRPDPNDIPNNHFAYAIQWFLFAGVAAAIYAIALRKRLRST
ncbi:SURF1 family protein [Novosphingobium sp. Gsoil 351]|uniref:SURF1 family protein n=1 Tax=Novosphingobium sp. Gsoil 351 TaxID=2675225 RepID=UPI0012B503E5|nr:SURF1 family protein [Novosphingobium sp. Gsoil 351]QGN54404.1 SURF1 family protein [Novosphingobium sp. Gsoil 351]